MNGGADNSWRLWKGPLLVWAGLIALFAISTASAYVPLGTLNSALNPLIGAVMVVLLVTSSWICVAPARSCTCSLVRDCFGPFSCSR
jgi:antibiotic biosynthesis monooxygenase (ABM) superfamily enzyme